MSSSNSNNRAPIAVVDILVAIRGRPAVFNASELLRNDRDPDHDPIFVANVDSRSQALGAAAPSNISYINGVVTYLAPAGAGVDLDSFRYRVSDSVALSQGLVVVVILPSFVGPFLADEVAEAVLLEMTSDLNLWQVATDIQFFDEGILDFQPSEDRTPGILFRLTFPDDGGSPADSFQF